MQYNYTINENVKQNSCNLVNTRRSIYHCLKYGLLMQMLPNKFPFVLLVAMGDHDLKTKKNFGKRKETM